MNVSFQYVQFDSFDGQDLDQPRRRRTRSSPGRRRGGNLLGFTANDLRYSLGLQNYITALSFTYGILDDLDVNILVPLIQTTFKVGRALTAARDRGNRRHLRAGLPAAAGRGRHTQGDKFGVGDILLRFKYQLTDLGPVPLGERPPVPPADGRQGQLPGHGELRDSRRRSIFSTVFWSRLDDLRERRHRHQRAGRRRSSQARYGIGVDVDVTRRIGLALGLPRTERVPGDRDRERHELPPPGERRARPLKPLLGVEFDRNDFLDFSFGVRAVVWREVMVFANGIHAVNDAGLRNDTIIPTFGVEGTF